VLNRVNSRNEVYKGPDEVVSKGIGKWKKEGSS
jgi:hypothetical protein